MNIVIDVDVLSMSSMVFNPESCITDDFSLDFPSVTSIYKKLVPVCSVKKSNKPMITYVLVLPAHYQNQYYIARRTWIISSFSSLSRRNRGFCSEDSRPRLMATARQGRRKTEGGHPSSLIRLLSSRFCCTQCRGSSFRRASKHLLHEMHVALW